MSDRRRFESPKNRSAVVTSNRTAGGLRRSLVIAVAAAASTIVPGLPVSTFAAAPKKELAGDSREEGFGFTIIPIANAATATPSQNPSESKYQLTAIAARQSVGTAVKARGPAFLLERVGVQQELRMDEAQLAEFLRFSKQQHERMVGLFPQPGTPGFPDAEEMARRIEIRNRYQREFDAAILKKLKPEQRTRLEQIVLQARGPFAVFDDTRMAKDLKLTTNQKRRLAETRNLIKSKQMDLRKKRGELLTSRRRPPEELVDEEPGIWTAFQLTKKDWLEAEAISEETTTVEDRAAAEFIEGLSDEQRERYAKFVGPPFAFEKLFNRKQPAKQGAK